MKHIRTTLLALAATACLHPISASAAIIYTDLSEPGLVSDMSDPYTDGGILVGSITAPATGTIWLGPAEYQMAGVIFIIGGGDASRSITSSLGIQLRIDGNPVYTAPAYLTATKLVTDINPGDGDFTGEYAYSRTEAARSTGLSVTSGQTISWHLLVDGLYDPNGTGGDISYVDGFISNPNSPTTELQIGVETAAAPEPARACLLALGLLPVLLRRRRR
ncbi:MAG: hypothetical protein IPK32_15315 [Verrucomicrobiaceae bacterium]|nr:hypothetical protein [Verrucomicrobiaceae bacterium]